VVFSFVANAQTQDSVLKVGGRIGRIDRIASSEPPAIAAGVPAGLK
jgi:hypothetical protein